MGKVFTRINYVENPKLQVHRYIAIVHGAGHTKKFHYCANLDEVEDLKSKAKVDEVVEVYHAHHRFREAWVCHS